MTFSEHLAERVHQLRAELTQARKEVRRLRASRDLWRQRALRKAGL